VDGLVTSIAPVRHPAVVQRDKDPFVTRIVLQMEEIREVILSPGWMMRVLEILCVSVNLTNVCY